MAISDWSTTPGSNGSSDASINFAEGQAPSTVNDSARSLMARVRHWFNWFGATTTSGGASNAYTLTSGESLSAYVAGMRFAWSPNADSTGAVTINVDTIGAKKVYMPDGSQANTGDLDADSIYDLIYDTALDSSAGGFKIVGFPDAVTSGALLAANNLSDLANATTARTNLGVAIGSNVQAYDAGLADIAGLAVTDGNFIVANGSNWIAESGATARTSLGLGSLATLSSVNNGNWSGTDLAVANGGTGASDAATARTNLGAYGSGDSPSFGTVSVSGTIDQTGTVPTFNFNETDAGIDEKRWRTFMNAGVYYFESVNDAFTTTSPIWTVDRNGNSVNYQTWSTGGSERMRLDSSGNVGIGTTSPSYDLHVVNSSTSALMAITGADANNSILYMGDVSSPTKAFIQVFHPGDLMIFQNAGSEAMRIDSSGNVGIGTTSPGALLDVDGDALGRLKRNSAVSGTLSDEASYGRGHINNVTGTVSMSTMVEGAHGIFVNESGSPQTIQRISGVITFYVNGVSKVSATLAARGVAHFFYVSTTVLYVSGDIS